MQVKQGTATGHSALRHNPFYATYQQQSRQPLTLSEGVEVCLYFVVAGRGEGAREEIVRKRLHKGYTEVITKKRT